MSELNKLKVLKNVINTLIEVNTNVINKYLEEERLAPDSIVSENKAFLTVIRVIDNLNNEPL